MPSLPAHHIPQTLIGLVLWLWWAAGAFAYSNPHPAHEFATVCHLGSTHSYNTAGDPTTANPNPAKTNYLYNALGQRVFKTDPIFGTPTADNQKLGWAYIYDETGTLLGEYGMGGAASSGSTEHIYLPTAAGPLPVATIINGQHYAVHTDHLNTPRRLTAANNQAVWQWAYSAFGQEQATTAAKRFTSTNTIPATGSTTTQPVAYHQRYPGQSFDVESGLHYNYFRTYDPQTGRYTQPDPIGLSGGWNRYAYVSGNPLGAVDPFGLAEFGQMIPQPNRSVGAAQFSYNPNDVRGGFDTDGRSLVYNPKYYDPDAASKLLLTAVMLIAPEFVAAGRAAGAICTVNEANIIANGFRGRASEARILQELGLTKNTSKVSTAEGRAIPDALTTSLSVEIKDAANVSLTRQLRIQTDAARATGRESVLINGERTCVSGRCTQAFDQVIRRPDLGPR